MSFLNNIFKKKNKLSQTQRFDINIPVENPVLISRMDSFIQGSQKIICQNLVMNCRKPTFLYCFIMMK